MLDAGVVPGGADYCEDQPADTVVEDGVDRGGGGGGGAQPVPQQLVHGVELGLRLGVELVDLAAVLQGWNSIEYRLAVLLA